MVEPSSALPRCLCGRLSQPTRPEGGGESHACKRWSDAVERVAPADAPDRAATGGHCTATRAPILAHSLACAATGADRVSSLPRGSHSFRRTAQRALLAQHLLRSRAIPGPSCPPSRVRRTWRANGWRRTQDPAAGEDVDRDRTGRRPRFALPVIADGLQVLDIPMILRCQRRPCLGLTQGRQCAWIGGSGTPAEVSARPASGDGAPTGVREAAAIVRTAMLAAVTRQRLSMSIGRGHSVPAFASIPSPRPGRGSRLWRKREKER